MSVITPKAPGAVEWSGSSSVPLTSLGTAPLGPISASPALLASGLLFGVQAVVCFSWNPIISTFSVEVGGPRHTPTLSALLDFVSFACRAVFSFQTGVLADASRWHLITRLIVGLVSLGHAAMVLFMVATYAHHREQRLELAHIHARTLTAQALESLWLSGEARACKGDCDTNSSAHESTSPISRKHRCSPLASGSTELL